MSDEEEPKKRGKSASAQLRLDRESQMILYQGASIGQIALLFGRDKRTVTSKIAGKVEPCGMRAGFPIYKIPDVAPYLVPPVGNFEEAIQSMHHDDIPPLLHRNYWAGKRERLKFEEEEGRLIDVFEAAELVAKAYKNLRMTILLMPDAIERETVLTDDIRAALKKLTDGLLVAAQKNLIEAFAERMPESESYENGGDTSGDEFDDVFEPVDEEGRSALPAADSEEDNHGL